MTITLPANSPKTMVLAYTQESEKYKTDFVKRQIAFAYHDMVKGLEAVIRMLEFNQSKVNDTSQVDDLLTASKAKLRLAKRYDEQSWILDKTSWHDLLPVVGSQFKQDGVFEYEQGLVLFAVKNLAVKKRNSYQ